MAGFAFRRFPLAPSAGQTTPKRLVACLGVLLLAVVAAGCGTTGGPRTGKQAAGPSAWQLTLDQVHPGGTVDVATALSAFALAVGPVPGARPVAGPSQPIGSGTLAVQWVLGRWHQLTRPQRSAVLTDLGAPARLAATRPGVRGRHGGRGRVIRRHRHRAMADGRAPATRQVRARPAGVTLDAFVTNGSNAARAGQPQNPNIPCLTTDTAGAAPYRAEAAGIEHEVASMTGGGPFSQDVYFAVNSSQLEGKSLMYTYGCTGSQVTQSGPVSGCTVHINPRVTNGNFSAADVHDFLIHELMHCYLFTHLGAAYYTMPAWYVEGVPTWAMNVLGNGTDKESSFWVSYLDTPGTPVFQRSYAALGFFVHLAETGTDVWQKILPMGEAIMRGGNAAGWAAAAPGERFLDSWGPGYAEGRYPGAAWQTGAPNLPHYEGPVPQVSLGDGHAITVRSPAAAVAIAHVDINAQVVQFSGTGSGRFSLDNGTDATLADAAGAVYTTAAGQAQCPAGSAGAGAALTPIRSGMHYIGLTGGLSAAAVTVQGLSLKSYCATRRTSCLVGNWVSTNAHVTKPGLFSESGGAGVRMRIGADGSFELEFAGMAPIDFTVQPGNAMGTVQGSFTYGGGVSGRAKLPSGGPAAIHWAPAPSSLDYSSLTATVHITSPFADTLGPMNLAHIAGSLGAGSAAMDSHPFDRGTFICTGNTLITRGPGGAGATGSWTFKRR